MYQRQRLPTCRRRGAVSAVRFRARGEGTELAFTVDMKWTFLRNQLQRMVMASMPPTNACAPAAQRGAARLLPTAVEFCFGGRRPTGYRQGTVITDDTVGRYFAHQAHLEAGSVAAFHQLAAELDAHRAPTELVTAAKHSALDEARHARMIGRLAEQYGATPPRVDTTTGARRDLVELAIENAIEGCVGETFGAAVAMYQARAAADAAVRAIMVRIAEDETRHAELAWEIDAWAQGRLDQTSRQRVVDARRGAMAELLTKLDTDVDEELRHHAGLPGAGPATAIAHAIAQSLL